MIGLRITHNDGSSFIFNQQTVPATNIWTSGVYSNGTWMCPNRIPEGYEFAIMRFGTLTGVKFVPQGNAMIASGTEDYASYSSSSGTITFYKLLNSNTIRFPIQIIAYPNYKKITIASKVGLRIEGNPIFLNDLPITGYAYGFYKKIVTIDGVFNPKIISADLTLDNAVYFFYSLDANSYIRRAVFTDSWGSPSGYGMVNTARDSKSSAKSKYYVIAFRTAKEGEINQGSSGLRIRNMQGKVTFNSLYDVLTKPILVPGTSLTFDKKTKITGIKRPMYTPQSAGEFFFHTDGGYIDQLNVCQYDAESIRLSRFRWYYNSAYIGETTLSLTKYPLLILDAEDYFKF
ncbi:hypothetical protein [Arsenophonus sp.]|uniref:hypothetical protein n=1 Tax=Arsenophonus sp. TaxID=1872640 RepID=UPI0028639850|nr:hypothetical protein [Arsenophonus sp.]MDR5615683.1 hypothetical protein [Arsenophonus sp.]MDR5616269.1 hypothetical protein [Arsenophonus sp.]MDR5616864.1 hypothetical protein [Arsenophonus sp.]